LTKAKAYLGGEGRPAMPLFPKIQSPCPYTSQLASIMEGDVCRMCKRQVFDLTHMADQERVDFLARCREEVCVSYRLRPALAAAALAASLGAMPVAAAAQEVEAGPVEALEAAPEDTLIWVGGIDDPANAEYIDTAGDYAVPELPVVYEDEPAAQAPAKTDTAPEAAPPPVNGPAGS
jgi:predicted Fe-S protein YdhL (DUF1289 family)